MGEAKVATLDRKHLLSALTRNDDTGAHLPGCSPSFVLALVPIRGSGSLDVVSSIGTFTSMYSDFIALMLHQLCCPMFSLLLSRSSSKPCELQIKSLLYARLLCVTGQSTTPQLQHKTRSVDTNYLTNCISSLFLLNKSHLSTILSSQLRRTSPVLTPHRNTESNIHYQKLRLHPSHGIR